MRLERVFMESNEEGLREVGRLVVQLCGKRRRLDACEFGGGERLAHGANHTGVVEVELDRWLSCWDGSTWCLGVGSATGKIVLALSTWVPVLGNEKWTFGAGCLTIDG